MLCFFRIVVCRFRSLTSWPKLHLDDFIEALRARGIILTATNSGLQRKGRRYGLCVLLATHAKHPFLKEHFSLC